MCAAQLPPVSQPPWFLSPGTNNPVWASPSSTCPLPRLSPSALNKRQGRERVGQAILACIVTDILCREREREPNTSFCRGSCVPCATHLARVSGRRRRRSDVSDSSPVHNGGGGLVAPPPCLVPPPSFHPRHSFLSPSAPILCLTYTLAVFPSFSLPNSV
ncbi:hypothetical protein VTK73DRAFT_965 [Phialemonium thermophilum]|uniref:Uncharacterized protein n=1 Tax=Phialemonium thermophilum TaxID=223376 RepID=A0ABR3VU85_9PEZI